MSLGVSHHEQRRRGVTIIEVLISIGVASIGLLGVVLLLPVAIHQVNRGTIEDRKAQLGRNAFREIEARGLAQPNMLVRWQASNTRWIPYFPGPYEAFCIDPRFLAERQSQGNQTAGELFPYATTGQPNPFPMRRVTLRDGPPPTNVRPFTAVAPADLMSGFQAERIFVSENDLVFTAPEDDRTLPALQVAEDGEPWLPVMPSAQPQTRRQANGRLSWVATVSPKLGAPNANPANNSLNPDPRIPKYESDLFTLSVVVIHNRDNTMDMNQSVFDEPANERSVVVSNWYGAGFGGGDVELMTFLDTPDARGDLLGLQAGVWVMLSPNQQQVINPNTNRPNVPTVFQWYRIMAAEDEPRPVNPSNQQNPGPWVLDVTLQGPDWRWPVLLATDRANPSNNGTRVTIMRDVVAVFEKTIRMSNSSLYTVN